MLVVATEIIKMTKGPKRSVYFGSNNSIEIRIFGWKYSNL